MRKMNGTDLELIAACLEGLEETIISKLIDRVQFKSNTVVYVPGKSGFDGESNLSLFDLRLRYQEEMDSRFGRFLVPEERPFSENLPPRRRKVNLPPNCLMIDDYDRVNLTAEIRSRYLEFVSSICEPGDDGQYGSSVEHDVYSIQAVSRRIHFGALYVAESKYRRHPEVFNPLIRRRDDSGLIEQLTRKEVEERVLTRVKEKVDYIQSKINPKVRTGIDAQKIVSFYREAIIPLTKRGELLYLQNREGVQ